MLGLVARRVDLRLAASLAAALFIVPEQSLAQSGPNPGLRPDMRRSPSEPVRMRPQMDLLNLRDRDEPSGAVTPLMAAAGTSLCLAGCGDSASRAVAVAPLKYGSTLAVVGPIEEATLIKVSTAASAIAPAGETGVVTCLAGCDASDRRVMAATGAPLPTLPRHQPNLPQRLLVTAATPQAKPAHAPTFKRSIAAHAAQRDKRARTATRRPTASQVAQALKPTLPSIATVGAPTPIRPADPFKPQPIVAKAQPVVSPRKPVAVNTTNDWFNKINRDQAARKAADTH